MENNEIRLTIRAARVNAGLTQQEAADAIGCSRYAIQSYEKGRTVPNWAIVKRMEEVYGIPTDRLIFARDLA